MTWITDGTGTRWVDMKPRKKRKPGRALRFGALKPGDVMIHRQKWRSERGVKNTHQTANDNTIAEAGVIVTFGVCEHRWFDPVAGYDDPVAGEMASVLVVRYSTDNQIRAYTLRGLAQNGFSPANAEQSRLIRAWIVQRDEVLRRVELGEISHSEAKMLYPPWRLLLQECGLTE